jgi:hypothetical protein
LAGVNWILTHLTSPAVTPALIALGVYVIFNWGAVRVLPFDGDGGPALGLQLSRALDAIDAGARSGLDEDSTGVHAATSDAPNVTIPGANVSLTALLGLLGETQVQGVLVQEQTDATGDRKAAKGEVPPKPTYRVRLQVHGPNVSARFETDPKPSRDEAITAAAEQLYAELEPVTAAYYFFFRDPDRSLALVRRALADPTEPRRYDAHHVSGLILRNQLDNDGALEELSAALASTTKPAQQASIYLDMASQRRPSDGTMPCDISTARRTPSRSPNEPGEAGCPGIGRARSARSGSCCRARATSCARADGSRRPCSPTRTA